jgi:GNAT superfamily N-acetyltransferase
LVTIKALKNCRLDHILEAWNRGFEGYFVPINMTLDSFLSRMVFEGLSTELSIVAFEKEEPIGIILNGIRDIEGKKQAWNGGTGVATAYRRKGVGSMLMEETLRIYQDHGVNTATLEAIAENHKAIALYESYGYQIADKVAHFSLSGPLQLTENVLSANYTVKTASIKEVSSLEMFNPFTTWQTQWKSLHNGEAYILCDNEGLPVGYALFKRTWNELGEETGIILYQLEIAALLQGKVQAAACLLNSLFGQSDAAKTIVNYPLSSSAIVALFEKAGFDKKVEQVVMVKEL